MTRILMAVALAVCISQVALANPRSFFTLESNQSDYTVGESATLTVRYLAAPENGAYEYVALSNLDGVSLPVTNAAANFGIAVTAPFAAEGSYTWTVSVFLQDKVHAASLKASIEFFQNENIRITQAIQQTTDPEIIAALQKERDRNLFLISQAESELASLRRPVGEPQSLIINVL